MIVKWNNNIVDYKCKVFFIFFSKRYKSFLFFFFYVGLSKKKKKREHATHDIRDSYYKPIALALCWCNPPGPHHHTERVSKHHLYWYTHLLHWHPTVGINAPPEWVHIAFRLKTGSALIAVWKRTASCSTF